MRLAMPIAILCLALVGCSGGVIDLIEDSTWSLRANVDEALIDDQHAEFGIYPNPHGVKQMTVMLQDDGQVCADDGQKQWCGGPVQGIPYLTIANVRDDSYCVRVVDIYGNYVRTGCQEGAPPEALGAVLPTVPAPDDVSGSPEQPDQPAKDGVMVGTLLVINAINAGLAKIGLKTQVSMPQANDLADFDKGDIMLGKGTCEDVADYLDSEFSDDHPGTDDFVFGPEAVKDCIEDGKCRIGQLVTRAMAQACAAIPEDVQTYMAETGIVGGGGNAVGVLCGGGGEIPKCVGSPLVLDLAGDGLQLKGHDAGTSFALFGAKPTPVGWLAGSDDALLALDANGNGKIDSGRELFGEATGLNGFAALARFDDNRDGVISAADAVFERLVAWRDNGDGRSEPSELHSLASLGIQSIALRFERSDREDRFGNQLGLLGTARDNRGRQVPVVDVWFRMGSR